MARAVEQTVLVVQAHVEAGIGGVADPEADIGDRLTWLRADQNRHIGCIFIADIGDHADPLKKTGSI